MLLGFINLLMGGDAGVAAPTITTPTVANITNDAACTGASCNVVSGSADTIRITWTISGTNNFYFETKVYRDGVLQTTLANNVVTLDQTAPGADGWDAGPTSVSYVYRVDVVNKDTGEVVDSKTAATFNHTYNTTCPGPC